MDFYILEIIRSFLISLHSEIQRLPFKNSLIIMKSLFTNLIEELLAHSVYVQQQVQLDNLCFKKANKNNVGNYSQFRSSSIKHSFLSCSDHSASFCTSSSLVHYYTHPAFSSWVRDKLKIQLYHQSTKTFQIRLLQRAIKSSCNQLHTTFFSPL